MYSFRRVLSKSRDLRFRKLLDNGSEQNFQRKALNLLQSPGPSELEGKKEKHQITHENRVKSERRSCDLLSTWPHQYLGQVANS